MHHATDTCQLGVLRQENVAAPRVRGGGDRVRQPPALHGRMPAADEDAKGAAQLVSVKRTGTKARIRRSLI